VDRKGVETVLLMNISSIKEYEDVATKSKLKEGLKIEKSRVWKKWENPKKRVQN
jgi:hypothetical protein